MNRDEFMNIETGDQAGLDRAWVAQVTARAEKAELELDALRARLRAAEQERDDGP